MRNLLYVLVFLNFLPESCCGSFNIFLQDELDPPHGKISALSYKCNIILRYNQEEMSWKTLSYDKNRDNQTPVYATSLLPDTIIIQIHYTDGTEEKTIENIVTFKQEETGWLTESYFRFLDSNKLLEKVIFSTQPSSLRLRARWPTANRIVELMNTQPMSPPLNRGN